MAPKRKAKKQMWREDGREESFDLERWPFTAKKSKAGPSKMAAAGFYYTGGVDGDAVTCFMCSKDLDGWEEGDDPRAEHEKHSPACPWMNLKLEENRFKTFFHWPHKKKFKYKAKEFARAGFVHVATATSADMVKCIACDKHLDGWEAEDNPLEYHVASCSFVAALKKQETTTAKKEKAKKGPELAAAAAAAAPGTSSRSTRGSRRLTRASIASTAAYEPEEEEEEKADSASAAAASKDGRVDTDTEAESESEPEPEADADPDATPVKAKPAKKAAKAATARKGSKKGKVAASMSKAQDAAAEQEATAIVAVDDDATPVAAVKTQKKVATKAALSKLQQAASASPVPDITVGEHLLNVCEREQQALTFSCEQRMRQFREEAAKMREVIRHLGDATNVA